MDTFIIFAALYVVVNIIAFLVYGRDKRKAENGAWRTPEKTLIIAAFLGPFGAYAGMRKFRHKTQKLKFKVVPFFLILHCGAIIWFVSLFLMV
ncbi:DUF1294 domain-containing protein [Methanogenium organophilum]|uniref:DUF1294 domain-containing protein n=1 Tax=Methanogenium organophilum TaxID=2199 RepID=A0A9X9S2G8_METOG|nr:DUF1294 domain-containing protein [Methanogenium organophilum]WAI00614.1 DUF1294 domain-containing protein [Methanogenium organophilum]